VVADCTGHGVPGAFMTLIAHTLLDKIVNIWGINEPHIILQKLHEDVVIALNQEAHSNNMGMDALVLAWKPHEADDFMLKFEGGKIDMHYVLPTHKQVDTLRATRKSIGGEQNEHKIFTTKILVLPAYTQIYVGSDGLLDQNDARRRRLGLQALSQVILQNAPLPISEQQKALQAMLADYMQGTFQRDDILWIGFRL
jgi:serine phosphatase RsbU (regulator of sigma subunit)